MKSFIMWTMVNIPILIGFIYGSYYNIAWLFAISYFMLWYTAIVGTLVLFIPIKELSLVIKNRTSQDLVFPYQAKLDLVFDIVMLFIIIGFGYWILGIFYIFSIYASQDLIQIRQKLNKTKGTNNDNQ